MKALRKNRDANPLALSKLLYTTECRNLGSKTDQGFFLKRWKSLVAYAAQAFYEGWRGCFG
jgi:hypothetical protein